MYQALRLQSHVAYRPGLLSVLVITICVYILTEWAIQTKPNSNTKSTTYIVEI